MKLKIINKHGGGLYGYEFTCPGCAAWRSAKPDEHSADDGTHMVPTTGPNAWGFNGDVDRPTFTPSILVHEVKRTDGSTFSPRCHSFVTDGRIAFCTDSAHALAGQTVDLPDVEEPDEPPEAA